jgi:hypothetical protein
MNKKLLYFYIPFVGIFILWTARFSSDKELRDADIHWLAPISIVYQVLLFAMVALLLAALLR